ncbi:pilus assembly protein TadG-related protein [Azospirillum halopraeferens]|uniref:pilus assembly protein TadG-related protein n=1 Tax=Azospirillum halopraeferens TaxID=34010 RepID=UPI0004258A51|nr:pilus assembly protein TadG-related protein [Azospirillum halopraeferens]
MVLAMMAAVPLACGAGLGFDAARGYIVEARLSRALDAAALAGGRVHVDEQRDGHVRKFFDAAFPAGYLGSSPAPLTIFEDRATGVLVVRTSTRVNALFRRMLGLGDLTVEARSVIRRTRGSDPVLTSQSS